MRRFLLPPELLDCSPVIIEGRLFRHMVKVLRLQEGEQVILCNGSGGECTATITHIGKLSLSADIDESLSRAPVESTPRFTLIQGLPKGEKLDLIIQKSTELGVAKIVLFPAARSVIKIPSAQAGQRVTRWQTIALEAARQSGRSSVPNVLLAESLQSVLKSSEDEVKLLLWENEKQKRVRDLISGRKPPAAAALLVGPEGGFGPEEISIAGEYGFEAVTLGSRILRTETAGLAMLAILQYQWGDLG